MKTKASIAAAAAALFLLAACAPKASSPGNAAARKSAAVSSTVVFLDGDVKIDGAAAQVGQSLASKVLVETGAGAVCEIVFDGKNAIRVGQNAVAALDFSGIVKEVSLKKGGLTSVLRKLDKIAGSDSFRVDTPNAVCGVRGTSFCVWVDDSTAYVCACNGTVRTIDTKGSNELTLSAAHHQAREYSAKAGSIAVTPAGIEHHDDASVGSLAARIGEKVDWTKAD
jgi:hypothetical protein